MDVAPATSAVDVGGGSAPGRAMGRDVAAAVAVIAVYIVAARVGFRAAFVAEQVTTVWAPSGIAIATLLIGGLRFWPAIWVGAFVVNATTSAPLWAAPVIATGNTIEAAMAAWALRRRAGFDTGLARVADVTAFVTVSALAGTLAATLGTAAICASGVQPWFRALPLWSDWWLGDVLGAIIVAPAILTVHANTGWLAGHRLKVAAFVGASVIVTHAVFGPLLGVGANPLEYVMFPLVVAAAVTGGPPLSALVVVGASAVTIWDTVSGAGPFAGADLHRNLVLLQTFAGVLAGTALLLSAALAERHATEQRARHSAARLVEREHMLRLAQRAGGVATFEWDFQNQIARCSAEFFAIFGLPAVDGEMAGADWARFVHPEDRERMGTHLSRALQRLEPATADYRIVRQDGATRWLTYAGQLQTTGQGTRLLGTVVDITDRKQSERALQRAKEEAESANHLKDRFLATLSHELRTPLNAILGYASMLRTNAIPPEKREQAIEVIERNAAAQTQLIEDLLDISRITRGQLRIEAVPVDVRAVIGDAIAVVAPAAEAKRIVVDVQLTDALDVVGDAARLQQIFWNLLTNAVKFTPPGGRVTVAARHAGSDVEVSVRDTGAGIASDFLPHIFEPFRQATSDLAGGRAGLGLGLAISRQLVELHGGTIAASSGGAGAGAAFVVRLPGRRHG